MQQPQKQKGNNRLLYKYMGLAMQLMVSLGLAVFLGIKADKWLALKTPLLVWILPLLVIGVMIFQLIKETSKK